MNTTTNGTTTYVYDYPSQRWEMARAKYLQESGKDVQLLAHLIECRNNGVEKNDRQLAVWAQSRLTILQSECFLCGPECLACLSTSK